MSTMTMSVPFTQESPKTALCMVGGPYVVRDGLERSIPEGSKRLLVFVALHGGRVDRRHAAGSLWPDGNDERASGNLRSALWRLKGAKIDLLSADKYALWLRPGTEVDVVALHSWARRVITGMLAPQDLDVCPTSLESVDMLPGWYDEWVIFERERLRQQLLHALEALCRHLIERRKLCEAIEAAMTAVNMEPLRESAQTALARAHLAEGNVVEARRSVAQYRELLRAELGIDVGGELRRLVNYPLRPGARSEDGANGRAAIAETIADPPPKRTAV